MSEIFGTRTFDLTRSRKFSTDVYDKRRLWPTPSFDNIKPEWKFSQKVMDQIFGFEMHETDAREQSTHSSAWSGWLFKQSHGLIASWQPRWFDIIPHRQANSEERKSSRLSGAVLIYQSETKGEQHLHVLDVRRERRLDSGARIALSIGFKRACTDPRAARAQGGGGQRMRLMAATELEAAALLSCLRGILEPGRAWPTLRDAIHFPEKSLRELE